MRVSAGTGPQAITVSLHPSELGQVEVRVERGDSGSVQVVLSVERPETLHSLLRDQAQLNEALGRAGVPQDARSLTFHLAPPEPTPAAAPPSPHAAGTVPASPSQNGSTPAGGDPSGQNLAGRNMGEQNQSGQDGRYRQIPVPTDRDFGAGETPGELQAVRWLRLGIDITA